MRTDWTLRQINALQILCLKTKAAAVTSGTTPNCKTGPWNTLSSAQVHSQSVVKFYGASVRADLPIFAIDLIHANIAISFGLLHLKIFSTNLPSSSAPSSSVLLMSSSPWWWSLRWWWWQWQWWQQEFIDNDNNHPDRNLVRGGGESGLCYARPLWRHWHQLRNMERRGWWWSRWWSGQ